MAQELEQLRQRVADATASAMHREVRSASRSALFAHVVDVPDKVGKQTTPTITWKDQYTGLKHAIPVSAVRPASVRFVPGMQAYGTCYMHAIVHMLVNQRTFCEELIQHVKTRVQWAFANRRDTRSARGTGAHAHIDTLTPGQIVGSVVDWLARDNAYASPHETDVGGITDKMLLTVLSRAVNNETETFTKYREESELDESWIIDELAMVALTRARSSRSIDGRWGWGENAMGVYVTPAHVRKLWDAVTASGGTMDEVAMVLRLSHDDGQPTDVSDLVQTCRSRVRPKRSGACESVARLAHMLITEVIEKGQGSSNAVLATARALGSVGVRCSLYPSVGRANEIVATIPGGKDREIRAVLITRSYKQSVEKGLPPSHDAAPETLRALVPTGDDDPHVGLGSSGLISWVWIGQGGHTLSYVRSSSPAFRNLRSKNHADFPGVVAIDSNFGVLSVADAAKYAYTLNNGLPITWAVWDFVSGVDERVLRRTAEHYSVHRVKDANHPDTRFESERYWLDRGVYMLDDLNKPGVVDIDVKYGLTRDEQLLVDWIDMNRGDSEDDGSDDGDGTMTRGGNGADDSNTSVSSAFTVALVAGATAVLSVAMAAFQGGANHY